MIFYASLRPLTFAEYALPAIEYKAIMADMRSLVGRFFKLMRRNTSTHPSPPPKGEGVKPMLTRLVSGIRLLPLSPFSDFWLLSLTPLGEGQDGGWRSGFIHLNRTRPEVAA